MERKILLEKYVRGELNPKEMEQFRLLCETDKDFAEEAELAAFLYAKQKVEQKKHWEDLLKAKKEAEAKEEAEGGARIRTLGDVRRQSRFTVWRIAAIFALVALTVAIALFMNQNAGWEQLAETELSQPYAAPVVTMGQNDNSKEEEWQMASRAYREGRFETSIMLLENMDEASNLDAEQHFYLGLSYLFAQPRDAKAALEHFEESEKQGDARFLEQIKWYSSLAWLQLEENDNAKEILNDIVQNKSWKSAAAAQLLEEL